MASPASHNSDPDLPLSPGESPVPSRTDHPDPITGEPDAHPVGVGVGALGGGAAGAAVGAFAGPVGMIVGAAIGAIAGGLAGKEVAESPEISPTSEEGAPLDEFEYAPGTGTASTTPLPASIAERTNPPSDAFFVGGGGSEAEPVLDAFDRPHHDNAMADAASAVAPEDRPLPTASTGLLTPAPDSLFADSTTGESSVLTESPFPAAHAVSPGDNFAAVEAEPVTLDSIDREESVRTRAYYRYLDRQAAGHSGSEHDDWAEAEKDGRNG